MRPERIKSQTAGIFAVGIAVSSLFLGLEAVEHHQESVRAKETAIELERQRDESAYLWEEAINSSEGSTRKVLEIQQQERDMEILYWEGIASARESNRFAYAVASFAILGTAVGVFALRPAELSRRRRRDERNPGQPSSNNP